MCTMSTPSRWRTSTYLIVWWFADALVTVRARTSSAFLPSNATPLCRWIKFCSHQLYLRNTATTVASRHFIVRKRPDNVSKKTPTFRRPPVSKQLVTVGGKKIPFNRKKLLANQAQGGIAICCDRLCDHVAESQRLKTSNDDMQSSV